uniref:Ig-like domain-containing protein n=1 Tax=Pyxicephalus adspersus TaxID=30357 RepID=A0AAV3AI07_PYXAD|nr:TPA: hypothetical protein GDO54_013556 [Pyxicephalus adspersus]
MLESGPGTVKPTETLELTCKVSGASLTDSTNMYGVSWFRQSENKQMEWLVDYFYNGNSRHIPFLQGRLTLSRDINKGEVFFKITGMRTEDSAKYYCVRYGLTVKHRKSEHVQ